MIMMLKFLLILGLAFVCQGYNNNCSKNCFDSGTYKCGHSVEQPCVCHVGFDGKDCGIRRRNCSESHCQGGGKCIFEDGINQCECPEGIWGRVCEHLDSEVADLHVTEKRLAVKYCGEGKDCVPPHMKVVCSHENLDVCDEYGNVRPFKKCPYPWYCFEAFRNGKCDWECERKECLYDGYECSNNRICQEGCRTSTGVCDMECSIRKSRDKGPQMGYNQPKMTFNGTETDMLLNFRTDTLIEFSLNVTEEDWWKNKKEIIANLSEPLRTPLIYAPEYNERLEKNKNALSRNRRSFSRNKHVVVNLSLLTETCEQASQCTADANTAGNIFAAAGSDKKSDPILKGLIETVRVPSQRKSDGSSILAVCLVIIAVPIVLIGYRVVSAPIWVPPKSSNGDPVVLSTQDVPSYPFSRLPTPLHEEAYSLSRITFPIRVEYVNRMDEQGRTPLFWLIASNKSSQLMLEDVNELVKAGANPNHSDDKGNTPLSIAITALRPSICDRLVQWGADPAAINSSGASCLHLAVAQDDIKCVEWLLSFPSVRNNINEVDDSDRTPLAMTAQGGVASASIAEILIEAGADVLHQGNLNTMWRYRGRSALHWAAQFNNLEVMKVLLHHRSDVNCLDTENCAALHLAVQRGSETAVRMLLEAQASTVILNGLGETPLTLANEKGIQPMIDLILWYTDVRKEGLVMKKKAKKREKNISYSGSDYSKRLCSDSPFFSDSISNHSGSTPSGYFYPSFNSDSSSVGSGNSLTSSSSVSTYSIPSSPWSSCSDSISSYTIPNKSRTILPPIHEKPIGQFSFDFVHSQVSVPPGGSTVHPITASSAESGMTSDYLDSVLLSPCSEISPHGSGGCESPSDSLGTSFWMDEDKKPLDGFNNNEELLHEFFVNWPN